MTNYPEGTLLLETWGIHGYPSVHCGLWCVLRVEKKSDERGNQQGTVVVSLGRGYVRGERTLICGGDGGYKYRVLSDEEATLYQILSLET